LILDIVGDGIFPRRKKADSVMPFLEDMKVDNPISLSSSETSYL